MILKRLLNSINRNERNNINDNWETIEKTYTKIEETADEAKTKADDAVTTAGTAKFTAETVETEFNRIVAEAGSNNPEVVQARGDFVNLNERLNIEIGQVTEGLAEKAKQSDLVATNTTLALKADKTEVNTLASNKADKTYVDANLSTLDTKINSQASGSPKGTYATLSALQTAFPTGNGNIYVVTADGKWYYWNGSAWTTGGTYQSTGIADSSVNLKHIYGVATTVNKNLFNKLGRLDESPTGTYSNTSYDAVNDLVVTLGLNGVMFGKGQKFTVLPNTNYTISVNAVGQNHKFAIKDSLDAYVAQSSTIIAGTTGTVTFNSGNNSFLYLLFLTYSKTGIYGLQNIQIEQGSVATVYEAYKLNLTEIGGAYVNDATARNAIVGLTTTQNNMDKQISNLNDIILMPNNVIDPYTLEWAFGHLSVDGSYYNNNNKSICTKDIHLLNSGTVLSVNNGYKMQIALFTTDDVLVDRILWCDNYTLDDDYKCRIEVATANEDVQSDFSISTKLSISEPQNNVKMNTRSINEIKDTLTQHIDYPHDYELNNLVTNIGLDFFKDRPLEIVNRDKFNVWPMIAKYKDGLICFYAEANKHDASVANPYYTISTNGISWSKPKNMFPIQNARMDVTGAGNDDAGNPLVWVRYNVGNFKLYKYDGTDFTLVSIPTLSMNSGHISNIFKAEGCLMCFWDSFNPVGSWGILKSVDNGITWTETVVESGLTATTKPTEICGIYLGDNKIIAIARRDNGSTAMDQLQSTDNGVTWTRATTNINEPQVQGNTPAIIYDSGTDELVLYYYHRNEVTVKKREVLLANVWDSPLSWGSAVNLYTFDHAWLDGGNLQAIKYKGYDYLVMYDATVKDVNSGIYSMIRN